VAFIDQGDHGGVEIVLDGEHGGRLACGGAGWQCEKPARSLAPRGRLLTWA
jgi:hypothetical protein